MKCPSIIPSEMLSPFYGCNGIMSDDELRWQIKQAVKDERYEWADKCKKELERRVLEIKERE